MAGSGASGRTDRIPARGGSLAGPAAKAPAFRPGPGITPADRAGSVRLRSQSAYGTSTIARNPQCVGNEIGFGTP